MPSFSSRGLMFSRISACGAGDAPTFRVTASGAAGASDDAASEEDAGASEEAGAAEDAGEVPPQAASESERVRASAGANSFAICFIWNTSFLSKISSMESRRNRRRPAVSGCACPDGSRDGRTQSG